MLDVIIIYYTLRKTITVAKNSIFQRTVTYFKAEYRHFLDSFKSDEKILEDQFKAFILSAETIQTSVADSILSMREIESIRNADEDKLESLNITIENLSGQMESASLNGDSEPKSLLRKAIAQQIALENKIRDTDSVLVKQRESVEILKKELSHLEEKKNALMLKKDSLQNRSKSADAMLRIQKTLSSTNLDGLSSNLDALEKNVRQRESIVGANKELNESSPENVFNTLAQLEEDEAIEARMQSMAKKQLGSTTDSNVISLTSRKRSVNA
jgi:phage shock protein A